MNAIRLAVLATLGFAGRAGAETLQTMMYVPVPEGLYGRLRTTGDTTLATGGGIVTLGPGDPATAAGGHIRLKGSPGNPDLDLDNFAGRLRFLTPAGGYGPKLEIAGSGAMTIRHDGNANPGEMALGVVRPDGKPVFRVSTKDGSAGTVIVGPEHPTNDPAQLVHLKVNGRLVGSPQVHSTMVEVHCTGRCDVGHVQSVKRRISVPFTPRAAMCSWANLYDNDVIGSHWIMSMCPNNQIAYGPNWVEVTAVMAGAPHSFTNAVNQWFVNVLIIGD